MFEQDNWLCAPLILPLPLSQLVAQPPNNWACAASDTFRGQVCERGSSGIGDAGPTHPILGRQDLLIVNELHQLPLPAATSTSFVNAAHGREVGQPSLSALSSRSRPRASIRLFQPWHLTLHYSIEEHQSRRMPVSRAGCVPFCSDGSPKRRWTKCMAGRGLKERAPTGRRGGLRLVRSRQGDKSLSTQRLWVFLAEKPITKRNGTVSEHSGQTPWLQFHGCAVR